MKINMFEGARRITKLIAVIWVVGWCIYLFTYKPYIDTYFRVDWPNSAPIRMGEQENGCEEEDARQYLSSQYTSKGSEMSVTLCFKPIVFDDGRKLILVPDLMSREEFKKARANGGKIPLVDGNKKHFRGFETYSSEVSNYTKKVADSFKLSKADEDWIDGLVWPKRWKVIKEGSLWIICGVAFLYIFSCCVGWIVRGFFGIPSGQDRRPDDM